MVNSHNVMNASSQVGNMGEKSTHLVGLRGKLSVLCLGPRSFGSG